MTSLIRSIVVLCFSLGIACAAFARPEPQPITQPTLAERGSALYRFNQLDLSSADGTRPYRVWVGIPKGPVPAQGYPAIYMLDGNAALASLEDPMFAGLKGRALPVLVMIGYPVKDRFDVVSRAYDYTPPLPDNAPAPAELARGRRSGGADSFADFIEQRVKPAVTALVKVDSTRQTLWGHSYGGLFAAHVLFTRPHAFQAYVMADPSLWWQGGYVLSQEQRFSTSRPVRVLVMRGTAKTHDKGPQGSSEVSPEAARQLAHRLAVQPNMTVQYQELPLGHGPMFKASLLPALRLAQAEQTRPGPDRATAPAPAQ